MFEAHETLVWSPRILKCIQNLFYRPQTWIFCDLLFLEEHNMLKMNWSQYGFGDCDWDFPQTFVFGEKSSFTSEEALIPEWLHRWLRISQRSRGYRRTEISIATLFSHFFPPSAQWSIRRNLFNKTQTSCYLGVQNGSRAFEKLLIGLFTHNNYHKMTQLSSMSFNNYLGGSYAQGFRLKLLLWF